MDFGEQYHVRMTEMMELIRRKEMDLIGDLSSRMAECLSKGNNVWMQSQAGHMTEYQCAQNHKANPQKQRLPGSKDAQG
ncbi:MAG: hypothetical protein CMJ81_10730 [Planctomycetaceae bacterium]|nr:hypothetical protein [Planctomycetaceae bacterium]